MSSFRCNGKIPRTTFFNHDCQLFSQESRESSPDHKRLTSWSSTATQKILTLPNSGLASTLYPLDSPGLTVETGVVCLRCSEAPAKHLRKRHIVTCDLPTCRVNLNFRLALCDGCPSITIWKNLLYDTDGPTTMKLRAVFRLPEPMRFAKFVCNPTPCSTLT